MDTLTRQVVNLCRRSRVSTYSQLAELFKSVRKELALRRPSRSHHLPQILSEDSLRRFYAAIDKASDLQHQIMLRLLFMTGIRVSELTNIEVAHVDLGGSRIFIESGKGDKDRYVLFPDSFKLTLKAHLAANPENRYLFESRRKGRFSTRQVQYIVSHYAAAADIPEHVHPHLLRHQLLTYLTREGLSDAQIQLVSGHSSKKSLEVYQHLALRDVQPKYQEVMKKVDI